MGIFSNDVSKVNKSFIMKTLFSNSVLRFIIYFSFSNTFLVNRPEATFLTMRSRNKQVEMNECCKSEIAQSNSRKETASLHAK